MPSIAGRDTANYRRLSRAHRADSARLSRPCWLCRQPIDYTLPADDPHSYSTDHVQPVSTHPHLAEDPTNLRAAHRRCNLGRGNRPPPADLGTPSRNW